MNEFQLVPPEVDELAATIVDAAFKVHSALGPGLLESVYEACLMHELAQRGIPFRSQVPIAIVYRGLRLNAGLRLDLLVEESIVVEIKAIEEVLPVHHAQLLTYLKLSGKRLGFLINFNVTKIKDGIKRVIL
ncbi:MAG TPA: GxxExxY protein [Pirellulales bacterium]|nr:GxxExxY protein [Pirellulales bacterium]